MKKLAKDKSQDNSQTQKFLRRGMFVLLAALLWQSGCVSSSGNSYRVAVADEQDLKRFRYKVSPRGHEPYEIDFYLEHSEIERQRTMLALAPGQEQQFQQKFQAQVNRALTEIDDRYFSLLLDDLRRQIARLHQTTLPNLKFSLTSDFQSRRVTYSYEAQQPLSAAEQALVSQFEQSIAESFARLEIQRAELQASPAWQQQVAVIEQEIIKEVNRRTFRLPAEHLQDSYYIDYARVALDTRASLASLADAFKGMGLEARALLERMLPFFQSIPYNEFVSAGDDAKRTAGFVPPALLFEKNEGDCDIKTTAMAALLKQIYPQLTVAIVLIEEHAFLGVALPRVPGDQTLVWEGKQFVLMEPTGPARSGVGQLSEQSARAVRLKQMEKVLTL